MLRPRQFQLLSVALLFCAAILLSISTPAVGEDLPFDLVPPPPGHPKPLGQSVDPSPADPPGTWETAHILVLLIQFPDYPADSNHTPAYYQDFLFSHDEGSMWHFYDQNSYGEFNITGDVVGWFNASHNMSYYGRYEFYSPPLEGYGNAKNLTQEAVEMASSSINFSDYDKDGDGELDHLLLVHSGPADESNGGGGPSGDDAIWSHRWSIPTVNYNETNLSAYTMQAEGSPMGIFAHEFGHDLGLPDLYDTDYSSSGIGSWGLMAGGSWNGDPQGTSPAHLSAWAKIRLGWIDPVVLGGDLYNLTIPHIGENDVDMTAVGTRLP